MNIAELNATARAMVAKNRGILAADESTSTIKKRFDTIKLESTEENRRAYREMLFTAPGAKDYISGVIMYDETIRQKTKDGVPFPTYLAKAGMIPGIKVDLGAKPLPGFPGETITEGLDGLRERFAEYHKLGARFAKWRAVINIDAALPTRYAIDANAECLARYAALAQEAGIVPIVEPLVRRANRFGRHDPETEHGDPRQKVRGSGEPGADRRSDGPNAEAPSPLCGARHRISVRWPESGRCHPALESDACGGTVALGADIQLRTCSAGRRSGRLGGQGERIRRRSEGPGKKGQAQRIGGGWSVQCRFGISRGIKAPSTGRVLQGAVA
jgi:hypothetical protein